MESKVPYFEKMLKQKSIARKQFSPQKLTYITAKGLGKLVDELDYLSTSKRMEMSQHLHDTMDEAEDSEYLIALQEQAFIEGRIHELEGLLANYRIIEPGHNSGNVQLGSTVVIRENGKDTETYTIVGTAEANPREGLISDESPLGTALLDSKVGDDIEINVPGGVLKFRIVAVQ